MDIVALLHQWGIALVLVGVLLDQGGLPLPAAPILIAAGAASVAGSPRPDLLLLVALAAAFTADQVWFLVGRRHGRKLLETICRISLSPDICVSRTDELLVRHGPSLLLFAKFVPGVSAVAIPTIAAMGVRYRRFVGFDVAGCLLWAGTYIGLGAIFSREIDHLLTTMRRVGTRSLEVAAALLALYVALKLVHRRRLVRLHEAVRIAPDEVASMLRDGAPFVILDARSRLARSSDPRRLPRGVVLEDPASIERLPGAMRATTVITFCTCPNEASAAFVAELLLKAGYPSVRVLTGGAAALDALALADEA